MLHLIYLFIFSVVVNLFYLFVFCLFNLYYILQYNYVLLYGNKDIFTLLYLGGCLYSTSTYYNSSYFASDLFSL